MYEGRAAILREIAKGLQMPVDEVVPSRENMGFKKRAMEKQAAVQMAQQGQIPGQAPAAETMDPGGTPAGGTNMVANQQTGQ